MIIYPNFLIRLWCLTNFLIQHKITFMNLRIFFHFAHLKPTFVYFTHSFLQNTHISLSILHIYSIKYSFFYIFYYFLTHGLSLSHCLSLSLRPNHHHHHPATIKPKARSVYLLCAFFVSHSHGWLEPKRIPIQAKTQGWSERRLIRPIPLLRLQRLIKASSGSRRSRHWQRGRHVLHLPDGWKLTNVEKNNVE